MRAQSPSWVPRRLAHLRRDRRGLPVPFINNWGPEDVDRLSVKFDRTVGRDALFLDDHDQEVPDFTRQNFQRQRLCVVDGLCQVCARPVPWSRRFLVVSDISIDVIDLDGERWVSLTEPWLDEECASIAVKRCPALVRRTRADNLSVVKVSSRRQAELVVSTGWVEGALESATRANPVAMWVKILLPRVLMRDPVGIAPTPR
jgi:hypothetical protein